MGRGLPSASTSKFSGASPDANNFVFLSVTSASRKTTRVLTFTTSSCPVAAAAASCAEANDAPPHTSNSESANEIPLLIMCEKKFRLLIFNTPVQ
jgi:hypothetical protein